MLPYFKRRGHVGSERMQKKNGHAFQHIDSTISVALKLKAKGECPTRSSKAYFICTLILRPVRSPPLKMSQRIATGATASTHGGSGINCNTGSRTFG